MNKKSYMKIGILLMVGLFICAGCSAQQGEKYTVEDLDNLAEIKIYSAENNELIKTISDKEFDFQKKKTEVTAESILDGDAQSHNEELYVYDIVLAGVEA